MKSVVLWLTAVGAVFGSEFNLSLLEVAAIWAVVNGAYHLYDSVPVPRGSEKNDTP